MDVCPCCAVLNCPRARLHLCMSTHHPPPVPTGNISHRTTVCACVCATEGLDRTLDVDSGLCPKFGAAHRKVVSFSSCSYFITVHRTPHGPAHAHHSAPPHHKMGGDILFILTLTKGIPSSSNLRHSYIRGGGRYINAANPYHPLA